MKIPARRPPHVTVAARGLGEAADLQRSFIARTRRP